MSALVLDSEAISQLAGLSGPTGAAHPQAAVVAARKSETAVIVPTCVLAEVYRGTARVAAVNSWLGRNAGIQVIDTDRSIARRVGELLHRAHLGSEHHVHACVVALSSRYGGGVILTSDPDDINRLAAGIPNITVKGL